MTFSATGTGGEFYHTLTTAEMPSHNHTIRYAGSASGSTSPLWSGITGTTNHDVTSGSNGSGVKHNNLSPHYSVYIWRRTA